MKKFKKMSAIVGILLVSVMLFAACGGISVKGEEISAEDFAQVVSVTETAMKDGYTIEMKGEMSYDGNKITMEGKMSTDQDGNSYVKVKISGKNDKAEIEMYVTKDGKSILKKNGKWLAVTGMSDSLDGISSMTGSADSVSDLEDLSFEALEYKGGRYYLTGDAIEEGDEIYYAFKDGKYIGGGVKTSEEEDGKTSTSNTGTKITYKSNFKLPEYTDASEAEIVSISADMLEFFAKVMQIMADVGIDFGEAGEGLL